MLIEQDTGDGSSSEEPTAKNFVVARDLHLEERIVNEFILNTCKCSKRNKGPCNAHFSKEDLTECKMQMGMAEVKDMTVLGQICTALF